MAEKMLVFAGETCRELTAEICAHLEIEPGRCELSWFPGDEVPRVKYGQSLRGAITVLVQSLRPFPKANAQLRAMVDAARRASAREIWVFLPYFIGRQDKKREGRVDISAKWTLKDLEAAGTNRFVSIDLHSDQIQGFVDVPFDNLTALPGLLRDLAQHTEIVLQECVLVSPDAGGEKRCGDLCEILDIKDSATIDKKRSGPGQSTVIRVRGEVRGRVCLMADDMTDSAGTLKEGSEALITQGAEAVYGATTHAVLGGPAFERLEESSLRLVAVSNSIAHPPEILQSAPKLKVFSVANLLATALRKIRDGESVSEMFNGSRDE